MPDPVTTAPAPAPHQVAAFAAEKRMSTVMQVVGLIVSFGGAILPQLSATLGPNSQMVMIVGAVIAAAATYQRASAHTAFQAGTDNG